MACHIRGSRRGAALGAFALLSATVSISKSLPASAYVLLPAGCHFGVNASDVYLNLNTSGDSDGPTAFAVVDAAKHWRNANTEAPDSWGSWPAPPYAGKGTLEIRTFTNAQSPNGGYLSTEGPPGFVNPSCGSSQWSSRPHIWLNYTKIVQREAAGHATYNVATAAHEFGHALGLGHSEGSGCLFMPLMDGDASDAQACNTYKPTSDERAGVNKIYN